MPSQEELLVTNGTVQVQARICGHRYMVMSTPVQWSTYICRICGLMTDLMVVPMEMRIQQARLEKRNAHKAQ